MEVVREGVAGEDEEGGKGELVNMVLLLLLFPLLLPPPPLPVLPMKASKVCVRKA